MPGHRRWRLFIESGGAISEPVTLEAVAALYAARSGDRASRPFDATWLTRFKIHSRIVERFRAGRVFVAGDAAHLHSPLGGQGITTGMQDAYNLGWKLAQVLCHGAPEALLDTYDEERRPAARAVLDATDRNTAVLLPTGRLGKWLRNHIFIPLLSTRVVQRRLFTRMSQLDMDYRGAALSWALARRRRRAGDRAPDVQLSTGTSLFALLGRTRFVALLVGRNDALSGALERLGIECAVVDAEGDLGRLYGAVAGDLWLIRPDGYIGLCCPTRARRRIATYLSLLWPAPDVERVLFPTTLDVAPALVTAS